MTKPNVVSEAPPGVARNAGVEGVGRRRRTSKRQSRTRERKCFATGPASATGRGPGDVRDVPRSHPQAGGPVLASLRVPMPVLAFKKSSPSGQRCLFLLQCKAEYKTHVRLESGDESPHSKVAVLPYGAGNCRSIPVPIRLRVLRWGRARRKPVRRRRGKAGIPGDGSPDSRAGKLRRAGR